MAALSVSHFSHFFPLRGVGIPIFPTLPLGEWEMGKGRWVSGGVIQPGRVGVVRWFPAGPKNQSATWPNVALEGEIGRSS